MLLRFYLILEKERVTKKLQTVEEVFALHDIVDPVPKQKFMDFLAKLNIIEKPDELITP